MMELFDGKKRKRKMAQDRRKMELRRIMNRKITECREGEENFAGVERSGQGGVVVEW